MQGCTTPANCSFRKSMCEADYTRACRYMAAAATSCMQRTLPSNRGKHLIRTSLPCKRHEPHRSMVARGVAKVVPAMEAGVVPGGQVLVVLEMLAEVVAHD